ncbi:hypothetical protein PPL_00039 [Heterostelium album PN500]|uniref:Uncharacterized protein n=1 Tax=Heterostelium pallidum (strain ATCC 26659 / Pp 5 / PN500) TaxID=670386 RepID=D3BVN8_HETP5|nr:hypothetical protein PPL_00039 [Heterostelium album PN500]EFA74541.1 hypothetical protein PPL_00039 [Heterostelium album PN500]|eukprot:XP_020426675.1 hypothetical protein PPL_00039 [Heterostelium album PN500]
MNWRNRRIFNHAIMANNNSSTSKGSSSSIGSSISKGNSSSSINSNRFSILDFEDNNNNDDDNDDNKLRGKSYYKYKQQNINYYNTS